MRHFGSWRRGSAALALLAAGCVSSGGRPDGPGATPAYTIRGLESVVGHTVRDLTGAFGAAALDIVEGPARKLQFLSPACVLDAYLYPPAGGGEPIVTYVDARSPDGRDFDRASCVAALAAQHRR